ncbi:hypothetical protein SAY87_006255 [Trapa incisa]|uniref:Uncharacterized protein n=1 Tax=Trapa incisa TaxID=236973 RepID=A0AAN7KCH3_9MYRT|nr:hypothetical protein SAY87_006255 [Trapa incisa]
MKFYGRASSSLLLIIITAILLFAPSQVVLSSTASGSSLSGRKLNITPKMAVRQIRLCGPNPPAAPRKGAPSLPPYCPPAPRPRL